MYISHIHSQKINIMMIPILIGDQAAPNARGSVAPATATSDSEAMKVSQSLAQLAFVSPACRRL